MNSSSMAEGGFSRHDLFTGSTDLAMLASHVQLSHDYVQNRAYVFVSLSHEAIKQAA